MTTIRNIAKNTRWGHTNQKTSTLHRHPKQLNLTEASLFDLLSTVILMIIDIWVSGLEHCDKFKAFVKNMNSLSNPALFSTRSASNGPKVYHM